MLYARELLTPIYGWFAEGFDTRHLKEAVALLEQLGAQETRNQTTTVVCCADVLMRSSASAMRRG